MRPASQELKLPWAPTGTQQELGIRGTAGFRTGMNLRDPNFQFPVIPSVAEMAGDLRQDEGL